IEHPRQGEYAFGFVTSHVVVETPHGKREMVTVFIPTNNLYLGDVVLVPRDDVLPTGLPVEEGVRIILSAGNDTPPQPHRHQGVPPAPRQRRAHPPTASPSGKSLPKKKWSAPSMVAGVTHGCADVKRTKSSGGQY